MLHDFDEAGDNKPLNSDDSLPMEGTSLSPEVTASLFLLPLNSGYGIKSALSKDIVMASSGSCHAVQC